MVCLRAETSSANHLGAGAVGEGEGYGPGDCRPRARHPGELALPYLA